MINYCLSEDLGYSEDLGIFISFMFLPVNAVINFDSVDIFQNSSTFIVGVGLYKFRTIIVENVICFL